MGERTKKTEERDRSILENRLNRTSISLEELEEGILLTIKDDKKDDWKYLLWTTCIGGLAIYFYLSGSKLHAIPFAILCIVLIAIFFNSHFRRDSCFLKIGADFLTYSNEQTSYEVRNLMFEDISSIAQENSRKTLHLFYARGYYQVKVFGVDKTGNRHTLLSSIEQNNPNKALSALSAYIQKRIPKTQS